MFDLTRLRLLRELAHRGTMTAVAEALGLTSSAVSQQLATLEREAGAKLLEQVGRRVRLTAQGERLAAHADTIVRQVETAALELREFAAQPAGELQVASFSTFAKQHLLPAVARAQRRFPRLRVRLSELESDDALLAVREGRCDLALSFAYNLVPRAPVAGLSAQPLLEEPVLLALPATWRDRGGAVDLRRLARQDWIVGSRQSDDGLLAERACAAAGFVPRIVHTIDDYDLMLRMVAAGFGIGFVPRLALQGPGADAVIARAVHGAPPTRRIQAWTRDALADSPLVRALLAELRDTIGADAG
ncbi:LysR family transcriptional regulator [Lysobacter sp. K5869]|uniref:LysR family transcriptional regulator n=1 Tax=Lysobacter sp. K5869 TaxID=2820808 RepID=UPI001C05F0B8|nr:LysR family transcriptional regulator [Lysobacter sp. K5869]QWP75820.1 LysR family transcriptional regulator [Lysobacter sp. K5869]